MKSVVQTDADATTEEGNEVTKKVLKKFLEKADKQQKIGPFNTRDSGILEEMHHKLDHEEVAYDDEPIVACPLCNGIYLKEINNKLECFNCGNEVKEKDLIVYSSIHNYLNSKADEGS